MRDEQRYEQFRERMERDEQIAAVRADALGRLAEFRADLEQRFEVINGRFDTAQTMFQDMRDRLTKIEAAIQALRTR